MSQEAFYDIIPASVRHVRPLSASLRPAACMTLQAFGLDIRAALRRAFVSSSYCRTATIDGEPVAMWGIQGSILGDEAVVWVALGDAAARFPLAIVRRARAELESMAASVGKLTAKIDRSDERATIFARSLGFKASREFSTNPGVALFSFEGGSSPRPSAVRRTDERPFIIHGLGRSRTAWLASFLTYGRWECLHEQAIHLRTVEDIGQFLSRPRTGYAETAASFGWPLILAARSDVRQAVIRRPPAEAADAMAAHFRRVGLEIDAQALHASFHRGERALRRISALPHVLTMDYKDLDTEEGCRAIFEFCLPYEWDRQWWLEKKDDHVEADLRSLLAYYQANKADIDTIKRTSRTELRRLVRAGRVVHAVH